MPKTILPIVEMMVRDRDWEPALGSVGSSQCRYSKEFGGKNRTKKFEEKK
jgi:hypothetical protein